MRPIVPEDRFRFAADHTDDAMRSLARAALSIGIHGIDRSPGTSPETVLARRGWDGDRLAKLLTRAATTPANITTAGWAAELAQVTQAFLVTLGPMSAAAALLNQCLTLNFGTAAHFRLPTINPGVAQFVSENSPIRVSQLPTGAGVTMEVFKLASIVELTREMADSSNAEAIFRQALIDSTGPGLDNVLFSNAAAVAGLHPSGLLVGATSVTASTLSPTGDAFAADLGALVQAIAPYAGNGNVGLIAAPAQATRLALERPRGFVVFMTNSLAAGTVIAVALNALVSAVEPVMIDSYKDVTIQEGDPASAVMTGQTRSLFQTDSIAWRLRWPLSWVVRDARAVAVVSGTKW
jgi:Phage capsid family